MLNMICSFPLPYCSIMTYMYSQKKLWRKNFFNNLGNSLQNQCIYCYLKKVIIIIILILLLLLLVVVLLLLLLLHVLSL